MKHLPNAETPIVFLFSRGMKMEKEIKDKRENRKGNENRQTIKKINETKMKFLGSIFIRKHNHGVFLFFPWGRT